MSHKKHQSRYLPGLVFLALLSSCGRVTEKEEFSWQQAEGESIEVYLSQHPYSESIIKSIPLFEEKTGIDVYYHIEKESTYYDSLNGRLGGSGKKPDVLMTGAYQLWDYEIQGLRNTWIPTWKTPRRQTRTTMRWISFPT